MRASHHVTITATNMNHTHGRGPIKGCLAHTLLFWKSKWIQIGTPIAFL